MLPAQALQTLARPRHQVPNLPSRLKQLVEEAHPHYLTPALSGFSGLRSQLAWHPGSTLCRLVLHGNLPCQTWQVTCSSQRSRPRVDTWGALQEEVFLSKIHSRHAAHLAGPSHCQHFRSSHTGQK